MMKNFKQASWAMMALLMATGCSNEEFVEKTSQNDSNELTIEVSRSIESRIAIKAGSPVWSVGDKLFVYGNNSEGWLTLVEGAGTDNAKFSGMINGKVSDLEYIVFGDVKKNGNKVTVTLDETTADKADAPLMGTLGSDKSKANLSHLCGLLALNIEGLSAGKEVVVSGIGIAGTAQLNAAEKTLVPSNSEESITISGAESAKTFYVPFFVDGQKEVFTIKVDGKSYNMVVDTQVGGMSKGLELTLDGSGFKAEDETPSAVIVNSPDALNNAIKENEESNIYLTDGTYELPKDGTVAGKTITISGNENTIVQVDGNNSHTTYPNAEITFEGITIQVIDQPGKYEGYTHIKELTVNNCTIKGQIYLYSKSTFTNCTFESMGEHCVWTYGAKDVSFVECDFEYVDRCVNVYLDNGKDKVEVTFDDCDFITTNANSKGAVEINSSAFPNGANINFTGCTAPSYGEMVFISGWDSANGRNATVTIDGAKVTAPQLAK